MSIVSDVDGFYFEHVDCGELEGEVGQQGHSIRVRMSCSCGALFNRVIPLREGEPTELR
jgi:hypothetical protein